MDMLPPFYDIMACNHGNKVHIFLSPLQEPLVTGKMITFGQLLRMEK